jgi:hypothetical protein
LSLPAGYDAVVHFALGYADYCVLFDGASHHELEAGFDVFDHFVWARC